MDKVEELTKKISELKSRIPAHSIKPAMLQELESLEEELEELKRERQRNNDDR